jgi:hypothetical protein
MTADAATRETDPVHAPARLLVEVVEPLGPGLELERDGRAGGLVATRARTGGFWLGLDRGALVDSDDGSGRSLPVLVAVPGSTWPGCRIDAELVGALAAGGRIVLVARIDGIPDPLPAIARVVADMPEGAWLDVATAARVAAAARREHRRRQAAARIVGGRAWAASGATPEVARFTTPHSLAEYSLGRLPPRFVRGLLDLLDPDERILYWVERPGIAATGFLGRVSRQDRRSALLILTDRQVAWLVDHADPDRYLSDWGIDAETIPVELVTAVHVLESGRWCRLVVATDRGQTEARLPAELSAEAAVAARLIERFMPAADVRVPRRRYMVEHREVEWSRLDAFGGGATARQLTGRLDDAVAWLLGPSRQGHPDAEACALTPDSIAFLATHRRHDVPLGAVHAFRLVLSPLVGRFEVVGSRVLGTMSFPAPFGDLAGTFVRSAGRLAATVPGEGGGTLLAAGTESATPGMSSRARATASLAIPFGPTTAGGGARVPPLSTKPPASQVHPGVGAAG